MEQFTKYNNSLYRLEELFTRWEEANQTDTTLLCLLWTLTKTEAEMGWLRICKIGTEHAGTTTLIAMYFPNAEIHTVDYFSSAQAETVRRRLVKFPNVKLWWGNSIEVAQQLNKSFNYIFIDGDHSCEGVMRDITAWDDKLISGGYLAFHDSDFPGVRQAREQSRVIDKYFPVMQTFTTTSGESPESLLILKKR